MTKTTKMRYVVLGIIGFVLLFLPVSAFAQSNDMVDALLKQNEITAGNGAYIILTAAGEITDDSNAGAALAFAQEKNLLSSSKQQDDRMTFGEFSYLLMKSFGVSGGVMYAIFPGPRYAAREVVYRGWSPVRLSPYEPLSGMQALTILRYFLDSRGQS